LILPKLIRPRSTAASTPPPQTPGVRSMPARPAARCHSQAPDVTCVCVCACACVCVCVSCFVIGAWYNMRPDMKTPDPGPAPASGPRPIEPGPGTRTASAITQLPAGRPLHRAAATAAVQLPAVEGRAARPPQRNRALLVPPARGRTPKAGQGAKARHGLAQRTGLAGHGPAARVLAASPSHSGCAVEAPVRCTPLSPAAAAVAICCCHRKPPPLSQPPWNRTASPLPLRALRLRTVWVAWPRLPPIPCGGAAAARRRVLGPHGPPLLRHGLATHDASDPDRAAGPAGGGGRPVAGVG
jgi:hypothetical protein